MYWKILVEYGGHWRSGDTAGDATGGGLNGSPSARSVVVEATDPAATVGDLAAALGAPIASLTMDGVACGPEALLVAAMPGQGARIQLSHPPSSAGCDRRVAEARGEVHRSARQLPPVPRLELPAGRPSRTPPEPPGPPWLAVGGPLLVAAIMAIVYRPLFAVFAALGAAMGLARWIEQLRRSRKRQQQHDRELAQHRDLVRVAVMGARTAIRRANAAAAPGLAATVANLAAGPGAVWQRRCADADGAVVQLGHGPHEIDWAARPDEHIMSSADLGSISTVVGPIPLDVSTAMLALVGSPDRTWPVVRSLVLQLAAQLGPGDLRIVPSLRPGDREWQWLGWLPHVDLDRPASDTFRLSLHLVGPGGESSLPLELPAGACVLAVTAEREQVPRGCRSIGTFTEDAGGVLRLGTTDRDDVQMIRSSPLDLDLAVVLARRVARFDDPQVRGGGNPPSSVSLPSLVGRPDAVALERRWRAAAAGAGRSPVALSATLGVVGRDPFVIDLVADGPHALVAGTTGAGKSELLRTLVASLASELPPSLVSFVLVDFKGGGAFDALVPLPHCAAIVTDLDDTLAARALDSLTAELQRREVAFRGAGVADLDGYRAAGGELPSLVIVVDEFATLAAELPGFVASLVDVAQRGRSLGLHLVLATQRPSGVVDQKIRANCNLRIALRVQSDQDSMDVVEAADAAALPRDVPGRAIARLGAGERVEFQAALSSVCVPTERVQVRPLTAMFTTPAERAAQRGETATAGGQSFLQHLAEAAAEVQGERPVPPAPWLPPLPVELERGAFDRTVAELVREDDTGTGSGDGVVIGIIDEPARQRRRLLRWAPSESLVAYGSSASGPRCVAAAVLAAARWLTPDELHVYVLASGRSRLAALRDLPHCGGAVEPDDPETVRRLLRMLNEPAQIVSESGPKSRERVAASEPARVLVVDDLGGLLEAFNGEGRSDLAADLGGLVRGGSSHAVSVVTAATDVRSLPHRLAHAFDVRLVRPMSEGSILLSLGLGDLDVAAAAQRGAVLPGGLAFSTESIDLDRLDVMVGEIDGVATLWPPDPIAPLPRLVEASSLPGSCRATPRGIEVPIGLDIETGCAVRLPVATSTLIAGGPGSGRTTTLEAVVERVRSELPDIRIADFFDRSADVEGWRDAWERADLIAVDDISALPPDVVDELLRRRSLGSQLVVATCRIDHLRSGGLHLGPARNCDTTVLLQPQPGDPEVVRSILPLRGSQRWEPGRGFIIDRGVPTLVQFAYGVPDHQAGTPRDARNRPVSSPSG